jgi:reductive dehalogenase
MSWLVIAGWSVFGLTALLALALAAVSIRESEWRALGVTLLAAVPVLGALAVPLTADFPHRLVVLAVLLGVGVIFVLLLILPMGTAAALRITGEQDQVDERDAVFHRFYRLEEGTPESDAYYEAHPEKKQFDDKVRAMPQLGTPGSRSYHPATSPFLVAGFDVSDAMARDLEARPSPLEGKPLEVTPEECTWRIKGFARHAGADLVGCTRLNPAYVYSHAARGEGRWGEEIHLSHTHAVAIAVRMSHEMVRLAPDTPTSTETALGYAEAAKVALFVSQYIRLLGYEARAHIDTNYRVMCIPIAADAGLGELGRHGLLITPKFGPRLRLAVVTTDLPLTQDSPTTFGVQHFCDICKKCAVICPSGSVDSGPKDTYTGVEKWQTRRDTCYQYWRVQGTDCALCIKVCPYAHPETFVHNVVRWLIRRNALARKLGLWADDLFYGRKPDRSYPYPDWHARD